MRRYCGTALARIQGRAAARFAAGATGLGLTVFYDVLTNAGAYVTIAGEKSVEGLVKFAAREYCLSGSTSRGNTVLSPRCSGPCCVCWRATEELNAG